MMHEWINMSLLLVAGILILALRPWPRLGWLSLFLFWTAISKALHLAVPLFSGDLFLTVGMGVTCLLLIGTIWEVVERRGLAMKIWLLASLASLLTAMFVSFDLQNSLIPRLLLFGGLACLLGRSLKERNLPLFALAFMGGGAFVNELTAAAALAWPHELLEVRGLIFAGWVSVFSVVLVGGVLWPEAVNLLRRSAAREPASGGLVPAPAFSGQELPRMAEIETILHRASLAATLEHEEYLNIEQVAYYLSVPSELATQFIERNSIRKHHSPRIEGGWVVRKSDIRKALEDQGIDLGGDRT